MSDDLTDILNRWEYDGESTLRIVVANDGRSLLQVRLPLGIEQYEMEGRPDGRTFGPHPTALQAVEARLREHIVDHGSDLAFRISEEDLADLQAEGVMFYYRYLLLFQLSMFDLVVRDTTHNLHLCDMLERYCEDEDGRNGVLQFRPYILRMNGAARALGIHQGQLEGDAEIIIENTIDTIDSLADIDTPAFQFERIRSTNYLRALARKLAGEEPESHESEEDVADDTGAIFRMESSEQGGARAALERELEQAVEVEDYERAARIRDRLRRVAPSDRVDKDT